MSILRGPSAKHRCAKNSERHARVGRLPDQITREPGGARCRKGCATKIMALSALQLCCRARDSTRSGRKGDSKNLRGCYSVQFPPVPEKNQMSWAVRLHP